MKDQLQDLLNKCIQELISKGTLNEMPSKIRIDHTKDNSHGDYATNIALMLSKQAKMSPVELAKIIIDQFEQKSFIKKIEIAGPGFINFFMSQETSSSIVNEIIDQAALYGSSEIGHGMNQATMSARWHSLFDPLSVVGLHPLQWKSEKPDDN